MRLTQTIFIILLFTSSIYKSQAQYIQVNDTYTAQQLVENVLINSPCANVSNFSVQGGNFNNGEKSYGYFTAGTSGFPFTDGVILSTSRAVSTMGPNDSILSETANNWMGDVDLEQALFISNTSDATLLEFDFIPLTSTISFNYIFASEEYHGNAPCKYSDGFAFLLKESGSSNAYQNLALIPNTTIPVKVTTVHPEITGACAAQNETYFGSYNGSNAPINFNGQTVVMTATSAVTPGTSYHIKLVIADETNPQYDSAIFLGGSSFKIGLNLGPDRLISTKTALCNGATTVLNATQNGTNSYQWFLNNVAITNATNASYTVNSPGDYSVRVTPLNSICGAFGSIKIEYYPQLSLQNTTLIQCDLNNDGFAIYNLTKAIPLITNNDTTLNAYSFYVNALDAQNQNNVIVNYSAFSNTVANTVYVRITSSLTGCWAVATIQLQVSNTAVASQNPISICDTDSIKDGISTFNLQILATPQILNGLPLGTVVEYYLTENEALLQINLLPTSFTNTTANQQVIYARIVNGSACYSIIPLTLLINKFTPQLLETVTDYICYSSTVLLQAPIGYTNYLWNTTSTSNAISVQNPGAYSVLITDSNGCTNTKNYIVNSSESAIITGVDVIDFNNDSNSIEVKFTGNGNYVFSLDGIHYQNSPIFSNLEIGTYTVWVKDINNCGITISNLVTVLDYPHYFTPNNDGFNDFWQIKNLDKYPKAAILLFDRYGKLLKQISPFSSGWDGNFNNVQMPADDYWFYLNLGANRIIKSHFTLKR